MREAAKLRGCDIGLAPWATDAISIETARSFLLVDPAAEERLFRLDVHVPGHTWEIGSTGDLGLLVEAVAAWREGTPTEPLDTKSGVSGEGGVEEGIGDSGAGVKDGAAGTVGADQTRVA